MSRSRVPGDGSADSAALAVEGTMFRALVVLRVVVLLNAVGLAIYRRSSLDHPVAAAVVLGVLVVWTGFTTWAYDAPERRRVPLLVSDLMVALAAVLLSPWVKGEDMNATLPGFWVMAVVLAWAIHWRWQGGLVAAVVVSAADLGVRSSFDQTTYGNIFLLLLGGPIVGFLSGLLQQMARERDRAERAAAAAAERARLARVVHDGVLQVLALVQRRGTELGGEAAELGRLAGGQELALRALVQTQEASYDEGGTGERDLAQLLTALATRTSPRVDVAVPGGPVLLSRPVAEEVVALVRACLHNVSDHVGHDARAWVLLEDLGATVELSVRDEGPGIATGRLDEAAAEGRLGVSESIRGRVQGLGGTARLTSEPGQGTEWEFTIPRAGREGSQ
ncbi:MAG: MacS family sensor histidine kinase [Marmoricola sp.]